MWHVACNMRLVCGMWRALMKSTACRCARAAGSLAIGSHAALGAELSAQSAELAEQLDVNGLGAWCAMCETGAVQPPILGASAAHNECGSDCITATQLAMLQ